mmetsp:Transcript_17942/g.26710  ORF Transcript_17942/g.26710 Transcript_17942/m.26710 type:complete len:151 (+) Transcript_17942:66-518(+)|eukprot:CAMPEP_0201544290 /NCGR_PEP_ID=MMETSP0173_2-20130828/885_1 /ASSEMBLY_ACC=CAM_ASM_000268 /TAXON_ID=218659 /ORGANISM="Vexillifera sp., Strain DIVA3 564/2" /LENGTH=150 /DNA_ID=CAMNT_0047952351 /DNA_START=61 /DNA_END=513 /DNA_ORIENTATION=+
MKTQIILFVVLLATLCAFSCEASQSLTSCGTKGDHWQFYHLEAEPNVPNRGDTVTISFSGNLDEEVTDGFVHFTVMYAEMFELINEVVPLCDDDEDNCPIPPGSYADSEDFEIPDDLPAGHYTFRLEARDQTDDQIFCVLYEFTLFPAEE